MRAALEKVSGQACQIVQGPFAGRQDDTGFRRAGIRGLGYPGGMGCLRFVNKGARDRPEGHARLRASGHRGRRAMAGR